jgi:FkbM family methyltransferase
MRKVNLSNGKEIYIYDQGEFISDIIAEQGLYFEDISLREVVSRYDVSSVVDIGANIGNHAHFFVNNCGSNVYCFEPSATNYQLLKLNCPDQIIFKVALGDKVGTASLITYESCKGNNTICELWKAPPDWGTGMSKEEVVVARLDDFNFPTITFIKIDVEGSELRVLKGALNTIRIHQPVLAIEMHPDKILRDASFEYNRSDIIELMNSIGYIVDFVDIYGNHFFQPVLAENSIGSIGKTIVF